MSYFGQTLDMMLRGEYEQACNLSALEMMYPELLDATAVRVLDEERFYGANQ